MPRDMALPSDVRRWLCPAARLKELNEGYARTLFVEELRSYTRGRSPTSSAKLTAGRSRRRTSDGEAEKNNF